MVKPENKLLESSVMLYGIYECPWETDDVRKEMIYDAISDTVLSRTYEERLDVARSMVIRNSRRTGKYNPLSNRPISVEFLYKEHAMYLLNNRKYLGEQVYVEKEFCKETEDRHKILKPYLRATRKLPQYNHKCRLEDDTLVIKGLSYTTETLHKLPENLSGVNLNSKSTDCVLGFFGSLNPLSNFHPCQFTYKGISYHCSEQYIQHMKSKFFDDTSTAAQILKCETALECKQLSRDISNYDHESWAPAAKAICEQGIATKFLQNETLAKGLLSTGEKILVECSYDDLWENGIPLRDENCLDQERWVSQGLLGEILMDISTKIKNDSSDEIPATVTADTPGNHVPQHSMVPSGSTTETMMETDQASQAPA